MFFIKPDGTSQSSSDSKNSSIFDGLFVRQAIVKSYVSAVYDCPNEMTAIVKSSNNNSELQLYRNLHGNINVERDRAISLATHSINTSSFKIEVPKFLSSVTSISRALNYTDFDVVLIGSEAEKDRCDASRVICLHSPTNISPIERSHFVGDEEKKMNELESTCDARQQINIHSIEKNFKVYLTYCNEIIKYLKDNAKVVVTVDNFYNILCALWYKDRDNTLSDVMSGTYKGGQKEDYMTADVFKNNNYYCKNMTDITGNVYKRTTDIVNLIYRADKTTPNQTRYVELNALYTMNGELNVDSILAGELADGFKGTIPIKTIYALRSLDEKIDDERFYSDCFAFPRELYILFTNVLGIKIFNQDFNEDGSMDIYSYAYSVTGKDNIICANTQDDKLPTKVTPLSEIIPLYKFEESFWSKVSNIKEWFELTKESFKTDYRLDEYTADELPTPRISTTHSGHLVNEDDIVKYESLKKLMYIHHRAYLNKIMGKGLNNSDPIEMLARERQGHLTSYEIEHKLSPRVLDKRINDGTLNTDAINAGQSSKNQQALWVTKAKSVQRKISAIELLMSEGQLRRDILTDKVIAQNIYNVSIDNMLSGLSNKMVVAAIEGEYKQFLYNNSERIRSYREKLDGIIEEKIEKLIDEYAEVLLNEYRKQDWNIKYLYEPEKLIEDLRDTVGVKSFGGIRVLCIAECPIKIPLIHCVGGELRTDSVKPFDGYVTEDGIVLCKNDKGLPEFRILTVINSKGNEVLVYDSSDFSLSYTPKEM